MRRLLIATGAMLALTTAANATPIDMSLLDGASTHVFFHDDGAVQAMRQEMPYRAFTLAKRLGDDLGRQCDVRRAGPFLTGCASLGSGPDRQELRLATDGQHVWVRLTMDGTIKDYGDPPFVVRGLFSVMTVE